MDTSSSYGLTSVAMKKQADISVRFGNRVRELRNLREISQERLADCCGLDRTYVGGIERGERNPSLKNIARLATALGTSMAELMTGVD